MPVQKLAPAMTQATGVAKTLRRTNPSVAGRAASSAVSSPVSYSPRPALAGESSTRNELRMRSSINIAAGTRNTEGQGRRASSCAPTAKGRRRPSWIMIPKMPAKPPRSRTLNQAALILTMLRAPKDWK